MSAGSGYRLRFAFPSNEVPVKKETKAANTASFSFSSICVVGISESAQHFQLVALATRFSKVICYWSVFFLMLIIYEGTLSIPQLVVLCSFQISQGSFEPSDMDKFWCMHMSAKFSDGKAYVWPTRYHDIDHRPYYAAIVIL